MSMRGRGRRGVRGIHGKHGERGERGIRIQYPIKPEKARLERHNEL